MLSLIELQNKKIEAKRKKYEKEEMDSYLELVFENYKELLEENKKLEAERIELNKKIKKLSDGVQYYRSIETTLQKALILAEKTSKETKDAAILKAESIEKEAHKRADHIIQNAEGEYDKIKDKCLRLVQQFNQYKLQLKEAASAQLQLVEGEEFDISNPDELEKPMTDPVVSSVSEEVIPKTPDVAETEVTATKEEAEPVPQKKTNAGIDTAREEILNADTIDLRTTLDAVKTETPEEKVPLPENKQTNVEEPSIEEPVIEKTVVEEPKTAEVKNAAVVEPVMAKPIEPMDIVFEDEIAANEEKKKEVIEPAKNTDTVPTLDSLLQDLNMNNKNDKKSDDPFEFLGSVDDF